MLHKNDHLACERVLAVQAETGIHEGQISLTHGFVPYSPPKESLPPEFAAWDDLQRRLPSVLSAASEREELDALPVLDASTLAPEYLARAASILGNFAHAYYFNKRFGTTQAEDPLPDCVRIPWEKVNERIGRQFDASDGAELRAARSCFDIFIANFKVTNPDVVLDGKRNLAIQGSDIALINLASGTDAERGNNITFIMAELRFAVALQHMINAVKAVKAGNDKVLIHELKRITFVIEKVTETLDHLTPNEHSKHYVDPVVWTKSVATFDGKIPGGHSGLSGSEFPLFQTLDCFFERPSFDTSFGQAFRKKMSVQPKNIAEFITALASDLSAHSLRKYASQTKNIALKRQYQAMLDAFMGLMDLHKMKAYGYMQINFLSGRKITNGGNTGERSIYKGLSDADNERQKGWERVPYRVTKSAMRVLGDDQTCEVILNINKSGLDFQPGDRLVVFPENSWKVIQSVMTQYQLDLSQSYHLNQEWIDFFNELGVIAKSMTLRELMRYIDCNKIPQNVESLTIDHMHPLEGRQYSQSPFIGTSCVALTVGRHFYKKDGVSYEGVASNYLVHALSGSALTVKKVSSRHFHLPSNHATPILMFAGGNGIGPFMGFIDARRSHKDAKNWLFYSTKSRREGYYYGKELEQAVSQGRLRLSVMFSRDVVDTVVYERKNDTFKYVKKYKGNHVDELIAENAKEIVRLIVEEGAHIFVCGSSGYSDTIRKALEIALSQHGHEDAESFVDTMMADLRYKVDVFSQLRQNAIQKLHFSDVAYHNKENDCWIVIKEKDAEGELRSYVYDMTQFMHVHPGGRKIIQVNAGLDGTVDYEFVRHHQRQQVTALLHQHRCGELVHPVFANAESTTLYRRHAVLLEGVTKIQNMLAISNKLYMDKPPAFMWRKTLLDFFGSSAESDSPFKSLVSKFFLPVCEQAQLQGLFVMNNASVKDFFEKGRECAVFLAVETSTFKQEKYSEKLACLYQTLMEQIVQLMDEIKTPLITAMSTMEKKSFANDFDYLHQIDKAFHGIYDKLKHIHRMTGADNQTRNRTSFYSNASTTGCLFARRQVEVEAPESSVKNTISSVADVVETYLGYLGMYGG